MAKKGKRKAAAGDVATNRQAAFRFNLLDKDEQNYFNDNCRWVFAKVFKENAPWWTSIDEEHLKELNKDRARKRFWVTPKGRRLAKVRQQQAKDARVAELL